MLSSETSTRRHAGRLRKARRLLASVSYDDPHFLLARDDALACIDYCLLEPCKARLLQEHVLQAWPTKAAERSEGLLNEHVCEELAGAFDRLLLVLPRHMRFAGKTSTRARTNSLVRSIAVQYQRERGKAPTSWPSGKHAVFGFGGTFPDFVHELFRDGLLSFSEARKVVRRFNDMPRRAFP